MVQPSSAEAPPEGAEPDFLPLATLPAEHPKHVARVAQFQRYPQAGAWHFQYFGWVPEAAGFDHADEPKTLALGTGAAKPPCGKYLAMAWTGSSRLVAWWPTKVALTRLSTARARPRRRRCWRWPGGERGEGIAARAARDEEAGRHTPTAYRSELGQHQTAGPAEHVPT